MDTMIVIEAVDTGCWNAVAGGRQIVTVEECAEELRRGDPSMRGYVPVREQDIARATVRTLSSAADVTFRLQYPDAHRLDAGERDLLALAYMLADGFILCSCDKAAVTAAHALGWLDRVVSLEALATSVGVRPRRPLRRQYTIRQLEAWRTSLLPDAGP
ncbi:MAG: hypothetical protein F4037_14875 [Gemmatimonadales bacterium]|nr:hypothetical protein [Gemmatimonadales bacterium]MYK03195.1 hypothetical protein [Candidatus Palauibacter ramosifaciens]